MPKRPPYDDPDLSTSIDAVFIVILGCLLLAGVAFLLLLLGRGVV